MAKSERRGQLNLDREQRLAAIRQLRAKIAKVETHNLQWEDHRATTRDDRS